MPIRTVPGRSLASVASSGGPITHTTSAAASTSSVLSTHDTSPRLLSSR